MDYIQTIKLLNELMLNATPQNVDFTAQNGQLLCGTDSYAACSHYGDTKSVTSRLLGRLDEGKTVSADLIPENDMLTGVENLPIRGPRG
jgi:hypothetical protein